MNNEEKDLEIKDEEIGETQTPSEEVQEQQEQPSEQQAPAVEENIVQPQEDVDNVPNPEEPEIDPLDEIKFSQRMMNDLAGKTRQETRDKTMKALYEKYGVDGDEDMDGVFGKGQAYDALNDSYNSQADELKALRAQVALMESGVPRERWDDVKLILGGNQLDITADNIASYLPTHPEWAAQQSIAPEGANVVGEQELEVMAQNAGMPKQPKKAPSVMQFGSDISGEQQLNTEEDDAMKMFGL